MPDATGFLRLLSLLGRENDIIRLARGNATQFTSAPVDFTDIPAALDSLDSAGWNVWFELNPTAFDRPTGRSNAGDIIGLSALYADLDFKPAPEGLGSLPVALEALRDLESALGVPAAAIVYSGHGIQPYWPISDAGVDEESRNNVAAMLKRWGTLVQRVAINNGGAADNVYDLARILRVPGPSNKKDPANPAPTHVEFQTGSEPLDVAWINSVLDDYEIPLQDTVEVSSEVVSAMADWEWAHEDCSFAETVRREIDTSVPASRHHWGLKWTAILHGMVRDDCLTETGFHTLVQTLAGRFNFLLSQEGNTRKAGPGEFNALMKAGKIKAESWSTAKLAEELRQHTHPMEQFFTDFVSPEPTMAPQLVPTDPQQHLAPVVSIFSGLNLGAPVAPTQGALALDIEVKSQQRMFRAGFTDTGNAEKLAHHLRGLFIWVPDMGWHLWDGGRFRLDSGALIMEHTKDMFVQMLTTAPDDDHRKWAHSSLSRGKMVAALELCKSVPFLVVPPEKLDAIALEANTPGGVMDIRAGILRPADPTRDFHTHSTRFAPAPVPIPKFMSFLLWAIGDMERIAYLQRLFGAALIGEVRWHIFPIFLGVGSNGKTTLLEIIGGCLGSYATVLPQKFLVETGQNAHPTEIAQLRGVRMAVASEVPPTAKFDEDLVKAITGENYLRGRFMGKDYITFPNTVTIFLAANHLPAVRVGGRGWWRRVRKIDFEKQLPTGQEDVNLVRDILDAEGPGIMQWILDGARQILAEGLQDPTKVLTATRAYQLEEDTLARFMNDTLVESEGLQVDRKAVYELYKNWSYVEKYEPLPYIKFVREITMIRPNTALSTRDQFSHTTLAAHQIKYAEED